jgi:2-polyprenyl-3-methyl-5-hydroxy-6-metoxy-1,4-benzoquinol methylase
MQIKLGLKGKTMRILVAMANYGVKNIPYAKRLIQEFRSMPFDIDIYILSEAPKDYDDDIKVLVGLPSKDPWTLPFAHKKLFSENVENYDLFIYTEDDTLIRKENIDAFIKATNTIEEGLIPGFVRYELYPDGKKNYPDVFGSYHWVPGSIKVFGEYKFARFTNEHSACYLLTQQQLRKALASGGFMVAPHSGRYDLICTAGNDPYIQCGMTRIVCFSHPQDFELHHLSNAYLDRVGINEASYQIQLEAMHEVSANTRSNKELMVTEKPIATPLWDKSYYEPARKDIIQLIPEKAKNILSIGCGWGETECCLHDRGIEVTVMPLDSVIAKLVENKNIKTLPPDFEAAFDEMAGKNFDAILLPDILQHVPDPVRLLTRLLKFLKKDGVLVGSVPNMSVSRRLFARLLGRSTRWDKIAGGFKKTQLHTTTMSGIKNWLVSANLHTSAVYYDDYGVTGAIAKLSEYSPGVIAAANIVFAATH